MEVSVLFFGQLTDITGCSQIILPDVQDTEALEEILLERYPTLREASYVITANRKIVRERAIITGNTEVALLPPFSGG